ncbi:MAG: glycosyltransferase family 4 protein [Bacteroidota bacterium]
MTKIVLITPILQHYRLTFYEKLSKAREDYDLHVLYGYKKVDDGRPSYMGETRFKSQGFREYKYRIMPFDVVYNWGMFTEVKRIDPDIVIMQGIAGDLTNRRINAWAKRNKKKIIIWACAWEPGRAGGLLLRFKNALVRTFFSKASYFLTYSTTASRYVERMKITPSIIETCYNGIEIDDMVKESDQVYAKAAELRQKYSLDGHVTFLYVGGLIKEKKINFLVDIYASLKKEHPGIKLIIIGDGPMRKELEDQMALLQDDSIHYLGRIVDGVDPYFAAADCFVLPGIGGLALNQAMFWKKTCIVSAADGTEDDLVIEGYSGYRFTDNDPGSLRSAMERRILETPEKVKEMSENAHRIIVEKSNVNNMVHHFVNGIEKVK